MDPAAAIAHGFPGLAFCADMIFPAKESTTFVYKYKESQLMLQRLDCLRISLDAEAHILSFT
jgi:hypothetical protein